MCIPYRAVDLLKVVALLLAAQQGVIELDATDKAFIAGLLSHALKEA